MKLHVEWGRPIVLKDASRDNMIYGLDLSKVTAGSGVYIFGRRWAHSLRHSTWARPARSAHG